MAKKQIDEEKKSTQETIHDLLEERTELSIKCLQLEKKLDIAILTLKLVKNRVKSFEDDPMNKIGFMAWWTLSKIKEDSKKALKKIKGEQ